MILALFGRRESRHIERGEDALFNPNMLRNLQLRSGVTFLFMFLVQAGTFFVVPLFLSIALGAVRDRDRGPTTQLARGQRRGKF